MPPLVEQIPPDSSVSRKSTRGAAASTDYRPHEEGLPTLWGNNTDPRGGLLPTLWGNNTDPPGLLYRPCRGRLPTVRGNPANKTPAKGRFRVGLVGLHDVVFVFNVLSC